MANTGKNFEKQFKDSVPNNIYYLRLTDSAIGFDVNNSTQRFAPKSPYDAILYRYPTMYALELKSTSGTSISFKGSSPMIKGHQIKHLRKASEHCKAGFIFNFRKTAHTYFVPIQIFDNITTSEGFNKKSVNEKDISNIPEILLIKQKLKKVNFKYDVESLFEYKGAN